MKLNNRELEALAEFSFRPRSHTCPWKPKTMARLEGKGLTRKVETEAYQITDAGYIELKERGMT